MQVDVRINGLSGLIGKINRIERGKVTALRDAAKQTSSYLLREIPPPPPPLPSYRRTGKLEKSFKGKVTPVSRGYTVSISNPTTYAPWVISDSRIGGAGPQAWMHRGRWYTIQQVLRKSKDGVLTIYKNALRRLMES